MEKDREFKLIEREKQHLEAVYDAIQSLQNLAPAEAAKKTKELNTKLGFTQGLDQITQTQYRYTKFDLFNRLANWSAQAVPKVTFQWPSDKSRVDFYIPMRLFDKWRKNEKFLRIFFQLRSWPAAGFANDFLNYHL